MVNNDPLRKVKTYVFHQSKYARPGHGSNCIFLECGHYAWRKRSEGVPSRLRCCDCGHEARNNKIGVGYVAQF